MAKITFENVHKAYGSYLHADETLRGMSGYYVGTHLTIQVDSEFQYFQIPKHTTLVVQYRGTRYQRNYGKKFSNTGIKLICARFQKDILNGKL